MVVCGAFLNKRSYVEHPRIQNVLEAVDPLSHASEPMPDTGARRSPSPLKHSQLHNKVCSKFCQHS